MKLAFAKTILFSATFAFARLSIADVCSPSKKIAELYAKEFEIEASQLKNINVIYHLGKPSLVSASHSETCGPNGCETALYYVDDKDCAKQVLLYNGRLTPQGKPPTNQRIEITTKQLGVDGGGYSKTRYEFDTVKAEYKKVK
jgi:hypothetical protein